MCDANEDVKFSLKVVVNKEKRKVLFAEVDSSFADVLLSFLTLPLGTIVRILEKHFGDKAPALGSLSSLYDGVANLDSVHFSTRDAKSILLRPPSSSIAECKRLKIDISESVSMFHEKVASFAIFSCLSCFTDAQTAPPPSPCNDGVFMVRTAAFIITDDLRIQPTTTGLMSIIGYHGIRDMDKAQIMNITFGFNEAMDLLKASLISSTPLSDIIFNKRGHMNHYSTYSNLSDQINASTKKMVLKVMAQKSTSKFLYAEAEEDFVEFLFSLLMIPLGRVEYLLASNSDLKSIDNLYKSIANLIDVKYFKNPDAKKRLIEPEIPYNYISKNQILPLTQQESLPAGVHNVNYLSGPRTYKVTDDLTVTPFCMVSILSSLDKLKIKMSDVKEVQLHIGLKEGLSILKASLTSTSALTDALLTYIHI